MTTLSYCELRSACTLRPQSPLLSTSLQATPDEPRKSCRHYIVMVTVHIQLYQTDLVCLITCIYMNISMFCTNVRLQPRNMSYPMHIYVIYPPTRRHWCDIRLWWILSPSYILKLSARAKDAISFGPLFITKSPQNRLAQVTGIWCIQR